MKRAHRLVVFLAAAGLAVSACAPAHPGIGVEGAWARPAQSAGTTAVYLVLINSGENADRLLRASSPAAPSTEIHETVLMSGDVVHMQPVSAVEIPAGGRVELAPGGLHLMLVGLANPLAAGDRFPLTLTFENAGDLEIEVEVRQP
jgi:hypothetical protein